jgi:hypothetical protein
VLITLCLLLSSASAISTEQRKNIEKSGNDYFGNHQAIKFATVTVNDDNTVDVWITPYGGKASGLWALQSIGAITNWYPTVYHVFPDIGILNFTLVLVNGKQSGYALPEWAAMVRWDGDKINENDLTDLVIRISKTVKPS